MDVGAEELPTGEGSELGEQLGNAEERSVPSDVGTTVMVGFDDTILGLAVGTREGAMDMSATVLGDMLGPTEDRVGEAVESAVGKVVGNTEESGPMEGPTDGTAVGRCWVAEDGPKVGRIEGRTVGELL